MVTIIGYRNIKKKDGTSFLGLEISSGPQLLQSSKTGKFYCSVQKCVIGATFSEDIAKTMLGQRIEGEIVRVPTEQPYNYVDKRSGEVLSLNHTYAYAPPGSLSLIGHTRVGQLEKN